MSIWNVNITTDRDKYCIHLQDEEHLFFEVPLSSDGSSNWARLQEWLDAGNEIADDMTVPSTMYSDKRRFQYPSIEDQLDKIFHQGIDAWKADIQAIKDANPKPE